jgi:hypothetical protein
MSVSGPGVPVWSERFCVSVVSLVRSKGDAHPGLGLRVVADATDCGDLSKVRGTHWDYSAEYVENVCSDAVPSAQVADDIGFRLVMGT